MKKTTNSVRISVRVTRQQSQRLDRLVKRAGKLAGRSRLLRIALDLGLQQLENSRLLDKFDALANGGVLTVED